MKEARACVLDLRVNITAKLTYVKLKSPCSQPGSVPVLPFREEWTKQLQTLFRNPSCSHSKILTSLPRLFSNPGFFPQLSPSTWDRVLARSASLPEPWPREDPEVSPVLSACLFSPMGTNSFVLVTYFMPRIFCCFNLTIVNIWEEVVPFSLATL